MERTKLVFNNASDIYNKPVAEYELQYLNFLDEKKIKKHSKDIFGDLVIDGCSHNNWFGEPNDKELIDLLGIDEKGSAIIPSVSEEKEEGKVIIIN